MEQSSAFYKRGNVTGTVTVTQLRMKRRQELGIDHNISISEMYNLTSSRLREIQGVTEITSLDGTESLAVLIPYQQYLEIQETIASANVLVKALGEE